MPNQRDIARVLGINQATVSLALRGDLSISAAMRRRICDTATRLGYRPNAYVSSLMAHIRSGRRPSEEGVIALLIEARSLEEWHGNESYRIFHEGVLQRAAELGFRVENFFLRAPRTDAGIVDRILEARGIRGVVFAPPYRGNRSFAMRWERYACVGMGHGWEEQQFDRVANDHAQNVRLAFTELRRLGYERIGMFLGGTAAVGGKGLKWVTGFLDTQNLLDPASRIPFFSGDLEKSSRPLRTWLRQWKPEVLLTLTGRELPLLHAAGLRVPEDVALACLVRPRESFFAGVDEKNEIIGAAALELVASQIARNEFGLPAHPRLTLIDGRWVHGASAPARVLAHRDEPLRDCRVSHPAAVSSKLLLKVP